MDIELEGTSFLAGERGGRTDKTFSAYDPATGKAIGPNYHSADPREVDLALLRAAEASGELGSTPGRIRARLLRTIAENLEAAASQLAARACLETGLPVARFEGETARACFQLRLFADLVEEGSWVDARIDQADAGRKPVPKPDVRSMLRPLGPVAVFCASNFPIAFSVAGGDTASALAAGCPVIVNAHIAHPGTSEIAARAVADAVSSLGLPGGVFSLLYSSDYEIGARLVSAQEIRAVGFTGSRAGGRALMEIASRRDQPIPVFAEMSSINPIFILPGALASRLAEIAHGLHASFTLGAGQFCTKPGVVFVLEDENAVDFIERLSEITAGTPSPRLLTEGIRNSYEKGVAARNAKLGPGNPASASGALAEGFSVAVRIFEASAQEFMSDPSLRQEVFGPTVLVVRTDTKATLTGIADTVEGQLTATIHGEQNELAEYAELIEKLETKAGRLIFNGYPTGVEVCHAMVHGGPFPATSDPRTTSVGTRAIERFARLICYQDFPEESLPMELRDGNPLGISRLIDGRTEGG